MGAACSSEDKQDKELEATRVTEDLEKKAAQEAAEQAAREAEEKRQKEEQAKKAEEDKKKAEQEAEERRIKEEEERAAQVQATLLAEEEEKKRKQAEEEEAKRKAEEEAEAERRAAEEKEAALKKEKEQKELAKKKMTDFLTNNGFNPKNVNGEKSKGSLGGKTWPLFEAVDKNDAEMVQILLDNGADPTVKSKRNHRTPLDKANKHNFQGSHNKVIAALEAHEKKAGGLGDSGVKIA